MGILGYKVAIVGVLSLIILSSCNKDVTSNKKTNVSIVQEESDHIDSLLTSYKKTEFRDINLQKDLSLNYAKEANEYTQLGMINVVKYSKKNTIKKINVHFDAYRVKGLSEYYYKNKSVIFVRKNKHYKSGVSKSPDYYFANGESTTSKFFFDNGNIIQCDEDKTITKSCVAESSKVLHDALVYKQLSK